MLRATIQEMKTLPLKGSSKCLRPDLPLASRDDEYEFAEVEKTVLATFSDPRKFLDPPVESPPMGAIRASRSSKTGKSSLPPSIQLFPPRGMSVQFRVSASTTANITVGQLLAAFGNITTVVNSKMSSFHSAIRLKRLIAWPPAVSGSVNTVDVFWAGGSGNTPDSERLRTLPDGITDTGAFIFKPPKNALSSFWWAGGVGTTVLFSVVLGTGTIFQVDAELTQANVFNPYESTVASAVLKSVYYLALDGPSGNHIVPIGLPTTA